MIKVRKRYIVLYFVGFLLLIFGNRNLWENLQEERKVKEQQKKLKADALAELEKPFEVQKLHFDIRKNVWKNNHISFQRLHLKPIFNAQPTHKKSTKIETNDDENASESL